MRQPIKKNSKDIVKVTQLNKTFISKTGIVKAIDNVSFSIKEGQTVGLIGESGSGKTTVGRALLRLYKANSGSVIINNNEYASKRISRKKTKKLRSDAQMIFQDPYSSLNGQKNILQIVSEPLIANGTAKKNVNEYMNQRKAMLLFFKTTLNSFYFNKEWKNEELIYSSYINAYKKSIKLIKSWHVLEEDVKLTGYTAIINAYYKPQADAKINIINQTSKRTEEYLEKWKSLYVDLKKQKTDTWDEKALLEATTKYDIASKRRFKSQKTEQIVKKMRIVESNIEAAHEEYKDKKLKTRVIIDEVLKNIELKNKEIQVQRVLADSYAKQNYLLAILEKNKIVLKVLKKHIMKNVSNIYDISSSELNQAISDLTIICIPEFKKLKKAIELGESPKISKRKIRNMLNPKEIQSEKNPIEIYKTKLLRVNSKVQAEYLKLITSLKKKLSTLEKDCSSSIEFDKQRDPRELFKTMLINFRELKTATKNNNKEINIFSKKYKVDFKNLKIKKMDHINKLKEESNKLFIKATQIFDNKIKEIDQINSRYLLSEHDSSDQEAKLIKKIEALEIAKNEKIEIAKKKIELDKKQVTEALSKEQLRSQKQKLKKAIERFEVAKKKKIEIFSKQQLRSQKQKLKKAIETLEVAKKKKIEILSNEQSRLQKTNITIKKLYGIKKTLFLKLILKKLLIRAEVFKNLKYAGLQPAHAFRYPHEFSGGMRQRVGIARAIINKPKFIIADEPIAALDLSIQAQIVNMLLEQKERLGLAMLFIAHDLSMVRFNSDRILIMHLGKLVEYGNTEDIFTNPRHPYTINLIKTMPSLNNLAQGFKDSTFYPTYLEKYSMSNRPSYVQVGTADHYILADDKQKIAWLQATKVSTKKVSTKKVSTKKVSTKKVSTKKVSTKKVSKKKEK